MVRRISALSQVLKETQQQAAATAQQPSAPDTTIEQNSNTALPQQHNTATSQSGNTTLPQNDIAALPQYDNTAKQQRTRKTDSRDKVTYYLDPGQVDKLDDLRRAYRQATGKRLNEQDFMRLIINRIDLQILL